MRFETIQGIVVKVTKEHIVVMTNEGLFKNILLTSYQGEFPLIGETITHIEKQKSKVSTKIILAVASLFLLVVASIFAIDWHPENEPAYVVAIDINPSIELKTDDELNVIDAVGLNIDGKQLLQSIHWQDHLYKVIEDIVDRSIKKGYFTNEVEKVIATSVVPLQSSYDIETKEIEEIFESKLKEYEISVELLVTNDEFDLYEDAKSEKLSINYYKQYQQMKKQEIIKDSNDIKGKSISELKKMEKEFLQNHKQDENKQKGNMNKPSKENIPINDETKGNGNSNPNSNKAINQDKKSQIDLKDKKNQSNTTNQNNFETANPNEKRNENGLEKRRENINKTNENGQGRKQNSNNGKEANHSNGKNKP